MKTSRSLWQYYRDELFINNGNIVDVPDDPDSVINKKITSQTGNNETKDVQIMVPLKY